MPIWLTGSIVFLVLGLGGFMVSKNRGTASDAKTSATVDCELMTEMPSVQIDSLLARLEMEEAPDPTMGAMCYSVMAPPDSVDYICPECGERTLYSGPEAYFFQSDLTRSRDLVVDIDSSDLLDAMLDESSFCSFCDPDTETPGMKLSILYHDGSVVVSEVSRFDLTALSAFLRGELVYRTDNDGTQPLKPYVGRIREILGVGECE